ncbi:hypothetical protein EDB86DRAFT_2832588 [Lactarius hatsudake]|nr:hypothetical protein EDB86DRAFT_2832588 [Lactarius hatsudake]
MTKKKNGLHFSVSTATAEQIELTLMPQLVGKMRLLALSLWGIIFTLLGVLDECHLSVMVNPNSVNLSELFQISEQLLGDLGEDEAAEENTEAVGDDSNSGIQQEDERRPQKRSGKDISAWNMALRVIKSVVCISIILQSANENCNHLQGIIGMFIHSANVPQCVMEVLAHAGLSISIKSIQWAVKSMSNDSVWKIRKSLCSLKVAMAYDNFDINFKTSELTIAHHSSFQYHLLVWKILTHCGVLQPYGT